MSAPFRKSWLPTQIPAKAPGIQQFLDLIPYSHLGHERFPFPSITFLPNQQRCQFTTYRTAIPMTPLLSSMVIASSKFSLRLHGIQRPRLMPGTLPPSSLMRSSYPKKTGGWLLLASYRFVRICIGSAELQLEAGAKHLRPIIEQGGQQVETNKLAGDVIGWGERLLAGEVIIARASKHGGRCGRIFEESGPDLSTL